MWTEQEPFSKEKLTAFDSKKKQQKYTSKCTVSLFTNYSLLIRLNLPRIQAAIQQTLGPKFNMPPNSFAG